MSFAKLLTRLREQKRLNKSELARAIGVTPEYIMMVESEKNSVPSQDTLRKICDILSLDKDQRKEFLYSAVSEKLDPAVMDIIQDYRSGFLADQAIKESYHGHISAEAECPLCHKTLNIEVKGRDVAITGKSTTKARIK